MRSCSIRSHLKIPTGSCCSGKTQFRWKAPLLIKIMKIGGIKTGPSKRWQRFAKRISILRVLINRSVSLEEWFHPHFFNYSVFILKKDEIFEQKKIALGEIR